LCLIVLPTGPVAAVGITTLYSILGIMEFQMKLVFHMLTMVVIALTEFVTHLLLLTGVTIELEASVAMQLVLTDVQIGRKD